MKNFITLAFLSIIFTALFAQGQCASPTAINGTLQWIQQQPTFNSINNNEHYSINVDSSGNVYITYYTDGTVSGGTNTGGIDDIVIFKTYQYTIFCPVQFDYNSNNSFEIKSSSLLVLSCLFTLPVLILSSLY